MLVIDAVGPRVPRGTVVRFLSLLGDAWEGTCLSGSSAYSVRNGIGFYACHFDEDGHSLEFYTEFDDLRLEEVRLLASIGLTVGYEDGFRSLYPDPSTITVPEFLDLRRKEGLDAAWKLVETYLSSRVRRASSDPPLPTEQGTHWHARPTTLINVSLQRLIFERISLSNHVLLRGLATWIKAGMLWMHRSFLEEANYSLFVSLDASFAVVCDTLRSAGNLQPTAYDAMQFVHDAFGEEPSGYKYFEEFYEDRIRTMHPNSRFGRFAYAPIATDDFYWLFRSLREVWRLLILGQTVEPSPQR